MALTDNERKSLKYPVQIDTNYDGYVQDPISSDLLGLMYFIKSLMEQKAGSLSEYDIVVSVRIKPPSPLEE